MVIARFLLNLVSDQKLTAKQRAQLLTLASTGLPLPIPAKKEPDKRE